MELLALVAVIWLFIVHAKLNKLTDQVEKILKNKDSLAPTESTFSNNSPHEQSAIPEESDAALPISNYEPRQPAPPSAFIKWLSEDLLMKIGALLLLIAAGWFVSYAFANNWIGPMGRITLGLAAGALVMIAGLWRIKTHPHQGGVLTVLGSSTIILTLYAARELYDFFTPATAFGLMFLSVAFVAFVSTRYNRMYLALCSLLLAGVVPLLVATANPSLLGLNLYLLIIVLGTLTVVYLRGWSILTLTSFLIVVFYGLPLFTSLSSEEKFHGLFFAFLFSAIFFVANIIGLVINENKRTQHYHTMIAFGTALYLIVWVLAAAPEEWQSLILTSWMFVFGIGSFLVYVAVGEKIPFYIYGAASIVLLGTATAAELQGSALVISLTLEALMLIVVGLKIFPNTNIVHRLAFLFVVPHILSLSSLFASDWRGGLWHEHFAVLVTVALATLIAGQLLSKEKNDTSKKIGLSLVFIASGYGLALIWLIFHAGTALNSSEYERATSLSLVAYTVIGITLHVLGLRWENFALSFYGKILIGGVIVRLLLVEVWQMSLSARIITFFIVGALLVATAFIRRHQTPSK